MACIAALLMTEVVVRSEPMRGSVFSLRLRASEPYLVRESAPPDTSPWLPEESMPSILVVDDDPLVLAGNRALLTELGCDVTTVSDGPAAEAALLALDGKPVLALCDLWLSDDLNGMDLLGRLSALTTAPFCGILISGDIRPETIWAAKDAGYPLLHKPVSPSQAPRRVDTIRMENAQDGRPRQSR